MKNQRPTMDSRICTCRRSSETPANRSISYASRPKVLMSCAPETPSVSVTMPDSAATRRCRRFASSRRILPTRRVGTMKRGRTARETIVSFQSSAIITASVVPTVRTLDSTCETVLVTTPSMPDTSLDKRLTSSPAFACVKKRMP